MAGWGCSSAEQGADAAACRPPRCPPSTPSGWWSWRRATSGRRTPTSCPAASAVRHRMPSSHGLPCQKPRPPCSCSMQETGVPVLGTLFSTLTARRCALQASGLSRCTTGTTTRWPGGCRAAGVSCAVASVAPAAGSRHAALWHCIGPFAAVLHRLLRCWLLSGHSCTGVDGCCTLLRLVGSTARQRRTCAPCTRKIGHSNGNTMQPAVRHHQSVSRQL